MIKKIILFVFTIISLTTYLPLNADTQNAKYSEITVVIDHNYPPYIFRDEKGQIRGYLIDLWKEWEKTTGTKVNLEALEWSVALNMMYMGNADVIDTIFLTEERLKVLDFSKPYALIEVPIFYHKNITGISDIRSLHGFSIGVKQGDTAIDFFRKNDINSLIYYDNYNDIINAAIKGEIKIFCVDKPPALYYLYKYNEEQNYKLGFTLYSGEFHRAVKKGNKELLEYIEKGFSKIPAKKLNELNKKWFGQTFINSISKKYIIYGAVGISGIVLLLLLNSIYLKIKIDQRTRELKSAFKEMESQEKKNRALIEAFPDYIVIIDSNHNILSYHAPAGKDFNISFFEPGKIKVNGAVLDEGFLHRVSEIIDRVLRTNETEYFSYESDFQEDSGYVDARITPFEEDKVLWIAQDVTEKKEMEQKLQQSQKFEMIGVLAGGLAHDFNNILHGISGTTSLLSMLIEQKNYDQKEMMDYVKLLEKTANRGASVVNQLLVFTREQKIKNEVFDLNILIKNTLEICHSTFDKRISVNFSPYPDKALIKGDPTQTEQALLNLFLNAHDSMTKMREQETDISGELQILLEKKSKDVIDHNLFSDKLDERYTKLVHADNLSAGNTEDGFMWCVQIRDTGVGIPQNLLLKIFDPFFTTKGQGRGTGLGLSMTYNIIKKQNGWIDVESQVGVGSVFTIYFPCSNDEEIISGTDKTEPVLKKGKGCILVVDDEFFIRDVSRKILEKLGYDVLLAEDGVKGVLVFKENRDKIDLVILDMAMPKMSGKETLIELKKIASDVKVLLCSGYADDERIEESFNIGIEGFIAKPFSFEVLTDKVTDILRKNENSF